MKLTVFQSDQGDCLLVTSEGPAQSQRRHMLVDGGMRASYEAHVAPALAKLRGAGEALDVVCVSHVDQDHIAGILQLFDDEVAWRVFDYQRSRGEPWEQPVRGRPPEVRNLWHNSFHEQIGKNDAADDISRLLVNSADVLAATGLPDLIAEAQHAQELGTSILQGLELSRRVGDRQLRIPRNDIAEGRFITVWEEAAPYPLGRASVRVIGPFEEDLQALRDDWNEWLRDNREALKRLRDRARRDEGRLRTSDLEDVVAPLAAYADGLGDRRSVTNTNLASIMLLVEEDGASMVLTGDGHGADVLEGLAAANVPRVAEAHHVDVLKVQHHGSEHNLDTEFARALLADHYVFCGNGAHHNPDLRVIEAIARSRFGPDKSDHPAVDQPFTMWFNTHPDVLEAKPKEREHMREVEALLEELAAEADGQLRYTMLRDSSFTIEL